MSLDWTKNEVFPAALADGLWVLGNYYFNLYLVQGEQASALIEVGVSAVADEVVRQLDFLGVRPNFLVVTHPHADHITGLGALQERFGQALVITGEGAAEFLAHPKTVEGLVKEDRRMSEFLAAHGIKPGRGPVQDPPSLANCLIAKDRDEMDLGGKTLRFLAIQGHSPAQLAVHVPELDALMISDALGFRFPGRDVFPLFFSGYAEYVSALDRLESLKPSIIGVAHQGPVMGKDAEDAFRESRARAHDLRERILHDSRPTDEVIREIFEKFYVDELTMYTEENILSCAKLVVRRAREALPGPKG
jgi:2-aminobenzoylacetyl-CoA thioesterase